MLGIVYCIREISSDKIIYVGSTTKLKPRVNNHIYACYTVNKTYPIYLYIRSKACNKQDFYTYFKFETLYNGECKSSRDLKKIEQDYLNKNSETVLNVTNAVTQIQDKAEWHKQYMNKYYRDNEEYRQKTINNALDRYYSLKNN